MADATAQIAVQPIVGARGIPDPDPHAHADSPDADAARLDPMATPTPTPDPLATPTPVPTPTPTPICFPPTADFHFTPGDGQEEADRVPVHRPVDDDAGVSADLVVELR